VRSVKVKPMLRGAPRAALTEDHGQITSV